MSTGNPERFPWGSNTPSVRARILVAGIVGVLAGLLAARGYFVRASYHSDFSIIWVGARALFRGANPYTIVGPGLPFNWDYPLIYPATSFVAVAPLAIFPEVIATALFASLSAFALVYGMTRSSWHLLSILGSVAFWHNARVGQWTTLATASIFIPALALVASAKPQAEIPILLQTRNRSTWFFAILFAVGTIGTSLVLRPSWPTEWLALLQSSTSHMAPPITRAGGFLVLFMLARWRRPESWLIIGLACMPQTWDPYNVLPLLTIAATYREAALLSLVSSFGALMTVMLLRDAEPLEFVFRAGGSAMLLYAYLPAMFIVWRRPNHGDRPVWLEHLPKLRLSRRLVIRQNEP